MLDISNEVIHVKRVGGAGVVKSKRFFGIVVNFCDLYRALMLVGDDSFQ